MKNNLIIIFFVSILINNISALAEQFKFNVIDLKISNNGDMIIANNGTAFSSDNTIRIEGLKFEYNKSLRILKSFNSKTFLNSKNLEIQSDKIQYDEIKSILIAEGNVEIFNTIKNIKINSEKILYDLNNEIIKSDTKTIIKDVFNNIFISDLFEYNRSTNIIKIKNVSLTDINQNQYNVNLAYVNFNKNKLIGKDIEINLNNQSFNKNNEPRLKGKSILLDTNNSQFLENTELSKAVFTLCKKNDTCPPWQLSANKIVHDKKNKTINYSDAWLKIYDFPVVYFPKFFHPDPTVKRKSGFLIPTLKNSPNGSSFLSVPYFHVLQENKDITIIPRFYDTDKILLQSEFRQVNKDSKQVSDFSILTEKNKNNKSHFFYDFDRKFNFNNISENNLKIKIQQTNDDTYLKSNNIKSILIDNPDVLESSINIESYSEDFSISSDLIVYENLTKNKSDRFEYILPKVKFSKNFNTNLNGSLKLTSDSYFKNYDTNISEKININDLTYTSSPKITKKGFYNNYEFLIKNSNSDANNSLDYKNDSNVYFSSLFQFNSSLPMLKKNENYQKILKPKLSLKIAPNNEKNISNKEYRLDSNNIFLLDRLPTKETVEGGISLTYGNEYSIQNLKDSRELLSINVANNLRFKENKNLPRMNQLGQKTSNFFSEIIFSPNEILTTKYNISTKSDLNTINYENLITQVNINNLITTFDYLNENDTDQKNSYLLSSVKYNFNDSNNLSFSTRENKTTNLTEYYKLIYEYKNDCLAASLEYNKAYYDDREIKPEESIFVKLTIIPFGETSSPNLKK